MKDAIRKELKQRRANMDKDTVQNLSTMAQEQFLTSKLYQSCDTIMLYLPLGNETQTQMIVKKCFEDGKKVLLPVTDAKTYEITAHILSPDDSLKKGAFSVSEPESGAEFDKRKIDLIIVPGIGFTKKGDRIGFGKGCYDRFLADYKGITLGLCYDFQVVDFQGSGDDIPVDYLITPSGITDCNL